MPEIMKKKKVIGTVPLTYSEGLLYLHTQIATGEVEGHKFTVNDAGNYVYVVIDGVQGTLPKIGVFVEDLVQAAYGHAVEHKLFKDENGS